MTPPKLTQSSRNITGALPDMTYNSGGSGNRGDLLCIYVYLCMYVCSYPLNVHIFDQGAVRIAVTAATIRSYYSNIHVHISMVHTYVHYNCYIDMVLQNDSGSIKRSSSMQFIRSPYGMSSGIYYFFPQAYTVSELLHTYNK